MLNRSSLLICARLPFVAFVLATSLYCLLGYIPFTRRWVVECPVVSWLPLFVNFHPVLFWATFAGVVATLADDIRRDATRRLALGFVGLHAAAGVLLSLHPLLPDLPPDARSFIWSLLVLFPLWWLSAIDHAGRLKTLARAGADGGGALTLSAALLTGAFVSAVYFGVFCVRYAAAGASEFSRAELVAALAWSAAAHLLAAAALFLASQLISLAAGRFSDRIRAELVLSGVVACFLVLLVVRKVVLAALVFNNRDADLFALVVSLTVVATLSGLGLRLCEARGRAVGGGLAVLLSPLRPARLRSGASVALWLGLLSLAAYAMPAHVATMDWNGSAQKLSVALVWALALAAFHRAGGRTREKRYSAASLALVAALCLAGYQMLPLARGGSDRLKRLAGEETTAALERYAGHDISAQLLGDILAPRLDGDALYAFLQRNTNIPASAQSAPVELRLSDATVPSQGPRPNVFIFVVDSLRQDYLSPYNDAVNFTPSAASFAREGLVARNAYTRYGGTILAEASIWTGAMLPHGEFPQPFYRLNSLQKLIDAEGYECFITVDPVLRQILRPSPSVVELDQATHWYTYDLARTLAELREKLDARADPSRPVFVYTQAQNLHGAVRNPLGETEGRDAAGFNAPYAAAVARVDEAFGEFVAYLKARGLYDNSIVVLTSDHGESFGEAGRWGHVNLFPEILRIPLIMHVPARLRQRLAFDPDRVAFSTDITPSLYQLLGHTPVRPHRFFGRSLFTDAARGPSADEPRGPYLVASSYNPAYGVLAEDARSLFITEGGNFVDYYFDLASDPAGLRNRLTPQQREHNERLIREYILEINRFYGVEGRE